MSGGLVETRIDMRTTLMMIWPDYLLWSATHSMRLTGRKHRLFKLVSVVGGSTLKGGGRRTMDAQ